MTQEPHQQDKQEWWEEEFDTKFPSIPDFDDVKGIIDAWYAMQPPEKVTEHILAEQEAKRRIALAHEIKSFISRTLAEERRRMLGDTQKILKELKLNFDAIVCECGEEWKDTDPAIFVEEKLNEIKQKLKE